MVGMGEFYLPAFAVLGGATVLDVGLLTTLPLAVGTAFQGLAPLGARRFGAKKWVVASAALQAASFLPLVWSAGGGAGGYPLLLVTACAYWALGLGITPAWTSWMGQIVPERVRGRYFARRNAGIQGALFASLLVGGLLIDAVSARPELGFLVVFALSGASRLASAHQLWRQHSAPAAPVRSDFVRLRWTAVRGSPLGRLILLIGLMNGAVYVSAAFFTPYMLSSLGLSYLEFTVLNVGIVGARIVSSGYWGRIGQKFGNRRALQVATTLVTPIAGLWLVSDHIGYLLLLQIVAGFAWAGFDLMTALCLFDATNEENRGSSLVAFNVVNGAAMVVGTLVGGLAFHQLGDGAYWLVFLGSSVLRALVLIAFAKGAGARQKDEHSFGRVLVRVVGFRPGLGPRLRPLVLSRTARARRSAGRETSSRPVAA